jgi:hypothetical protein
MKGLPLIGRESKRRSHDVYKSSSSNAGTGGQPRRASLIDAARYDVEHRWSRNDKQHDGSRHEKKQFARRRQETHGLAKNSTTETTERSGKRASLIMVDSPLQ